MPLTCAGLFEHRVIDGDVVAEREGLLQGGCEAAGSETGQGSQHGRGFGQVAAKLVEQDVGAPEEHAGVPVEVAGGQIAFGVGQLGLLVETAHGKRLCAGLGSAREFDVAVTGFGPARLDADHHQVARGGGFQGGPENGAVPAGLSHHVVGWEHAHHGIGIERAEDVRRQADGGRGVALHGLGQNLIRGNFGKLADDGAAQVRVGQNPHSLGRDHGGQPLHRGLDQGTLPRHIEHLLGGALAAPRPEARSASSGEDQSRNDEGSFT